MVGSEELLHLQGQSQADQVHDDVLIGQLDGEDGERGKEQLKVLVDVVLLLTAQVDVAVQLLPVLQRRSENIRENQRRSENIKKHRRNVRETSGQRTSGVDQSLKLEPSS